MPKYYALIPAAGHGARLGSEVPKQYLSILNEPLIYHALRALCTHPLIDRVFVVLAPDDQLWFKLDFSEFEEKLTPLFCGGETRSDTVLNGMNTIQDIVGSEDWMLVHDAARPCLDIRQLDKLILEVGDDKVGGLLAVPLTDTLKRADRFTRVVNTERREGLWQAQTPQMFRFGLLKRAMESVDAATTTDEAQAIEQLSLQPKLIANTYRNLKVTYREDLELAQTILAADIRHLDS